MQPHSHRHTQRRRWGRTARACGAIVACLLPLGVFTGCSDEVQQRFAAAALGSVSDGLKAIADGLITGLTTIATPSSTDPNSTSSNSSTTG